MKKRLAILLTGLTAASMSAAMPVCAFAAENDAAAEIKNEGTESVHEVAETGDADTSASESTVSTPESSVSPPEVHEDTVQNEDGSTTTTTTSTVTETTTTPLDPVVTTTLVNEVDSDYHTITDEEGNELESYEKTTTTAASEISTETVTTTTVTTETSKMTNAVDTENATVENVTEGGTVAPANTETEAAAKEFLEDQNVTSDFAIYADKIDESIGHVDGNVAVNTMTTGGQVDIMNKEDSQYGTGNADSYAENGYSYVGSTENGTTIKTTSNQTKDGEVLSKLVVGEGVTITDNTHGSAGHFQLETAETKEEGGVTSESAKKLAASDKRLTDIEKTSDINTNLDQIAASGQKLIDATKDADGTGSAENDLRKIAAAIESLVQRKSSASGNKTSILNVTIHSGLLTDARFTNELNNTKLFQDLVRKNASNTKVIVSVDCSDADEEAGITAYCNPSNDISNYDNRAANLFWNFGAYAGKITLESQWLGNIIAVNATVHANAGIQSGRIVARTAGHKAGEIHMAVSGNVLTKKVSSEPVVTRSDKKTVIVSSEPGVAYKYRRKEKTSEPIVPDTPAEPDQPVTPVVPSAPDTPGRTEIMTPGTDTKVVTPSGSGSSSTPGAVITLTVSTAPEKEDSTSEDGSYTEELPQLVLGETRPDEASGDSGEESATKSNIQGRSPQTGDESNMALWGSLAAASLCALGFTMARQKGER